MLFTTPKVPVTLALLMCLTSHIKETLGRPTDQDNEASKPDQFAPQNPSIPAPNDSPMKSGGFRVSRSTEGFLPPTIKNRVHGRSSRFHEGAGHPRTGAGGNLAGYSSPIARMLVSRDPQVDESSVAPGVGGILNEQDPTFTPYISARVFNMPRFMDQVKLNLQSMTDDLDLPSDEIEYDENDFDSVGLGINGEIIPGNDARFVPEHKGIRYFPIGGRPRMMNIRNFVQQPSELESVYRNYLNSPRSVYEFGLG